MRRFAPLAVLVAALFHGSLVRAAKSLAIDIHRDTNYGCCKDWIKHLEANSFKITSYVETDMSVVKNHLGVPYSMGPYHTGMIDGKFIEGHVPAADILRLRERADLVGAAVPGIPVGSPGMEIGDHQDAYQVVGLTRSGQTSVLTERPGCQRKRRFPQEKRRFSL